VTPLFGGAIGLDITKRIVILEAGAGMTHDTLALANGARHAYL
jgi:hypothetical protein